MYTFAWWNNTEGLRLAVGSYLQQEANKVQVLEVSEDKKRLEMVAETEMSFPATKLMWSPNSEEHKAEAPLLASTSITLNLWKYEEKQLKPIAKLANARTNKAGGHTPPLTSFDWSPISRHKIGASSVDSTCTIWNIEKQKIETQLIAHDKAVHDIVFSQKDCLFASVGADGSVRLFDQRNLDHSTIIYEAPNNRPLARLAWNRVNTYHLATLAMDTPGVIVIDIRRPSVALTVLSEFDECVNAIAWAPHSPSHLLCGSDDGYAMIYDVRTGEKKKPGSREQEAGQSQSSPQVFWHDCDQEIYQVQWQASHPELIGLSTANRVDVVNI